MLVTLRDRGLPLPAGAILISPWVDLTHSFPSVGAENPLDYIPPHGFHQRPSPSWPPPNSDDMLAMEEGIVKGMAHKNHASSPRDNEADAVQGFHVDHNPATGTRNDTAATGTVSHDGTGPNANTVPGPGHNLSIMIDGKLIEIKDQIQMYASNQLISHPLVSPILQPSLGGLPPLLILTGGGEMLRDEQIYLAHKAANPTAYPPGDAFLDENPHDHNRHQVDRWKPTDVQLQVWDDLCHVCPTLSFTRPAKYMYRSIAQFGAWALARAQKIDIEIVDDDDVSIISQSGSDEDAAKSQKKGDVGVGHVGRAGDPLPAFRSHMIRQRVDRHGNTYNLEPATELAGCQLPPSQIGVIKEAPVKKWMAAKREWDTKYASSKRKVQKQRAKEMAQGYQQFGDGEVPPPSALAGRRKVGGVDLSEPKKTRSYGLSMWSMFGSKHDEKTMILEQQHDNAPETTTAHAGQGAGARALDDTNENTPAAAERPKGADTRSRSKRRTVRDENQTDSVDENTSAADLAAIRVRDGDIHDEQLTPEAHPDNPIITISSPTAVHESELKRPKHEGIAYPFTVKKHATSDSMATLESKAGFPPTEDVMTEGAVSSGVNHNVADFEASTSTGNSTEASKARRASEAEVSGELVNGKGKGVMRRIDTDDSLANFLYHDKGKPKVVENGQVVSAERPPLDSFVTAREELLPKSPTASAVEEGDLLESRLRF